MEAGGSARGPRGLDLRGRLRPTGVKAVVESLWSGHFPPLNTLVSGIRGQRGWQGCLTQQVPLGLVQLKLTPAN